LIVKQIYTGCLSQGAYFIESNGEAAVIDPLREVSHYIDLANKYKSKIKYIFETHFHADFVSGHLSLAKKTGASIVFGPNAKPEFKTIVANDNEIFKIGNVTLTTIHTPGHTLESTSYLLKDENGTEHCIFTGDTLFLGDVGIPDVAQRYAGVSKEELAGILHDSINNRIKPLPNDILVYPGHGAGSACGKNMMKETVDTLENQKKINYSLNDSLSREDFIKELTYNLPEPPTYFPSNVKLNIEGCPDFDDVLKSNLNSLNLQEFKVLSNSNETVVLDVRTSDLFSKGFIPGSIFIGLNGQFAPWVGSVLKDVNTQILIVCEKNKEKEVITRLSRVGFDNVLGYLEGGFDSWKKSNEKIDHINSISALDLKKIINNKLSLLDVRKNSETKNGFLTGTINIPLNDIDLHISKLNKLRSHYVHCAGGYRSMIACSIFKKSGIDNLFDISGGFSEIKKANLKINYK
jgi:glyoxylase-like metal-dependent hydrolase (beta-lactamase superfamily II)/rhodanese-related sulfurtransferase